MVPELPKIGAPAKRALASIGISNLEQLRSHSKQEIMSLHGMGPNALGKLIEAMQAAGFEFDSQ